MNNRLKRSLRINLKSCKHNKWECEGTYESCGKVFKQEVCKKCELMKSTLICDHNPELIEKDYKDPWKPRYWRY